MWHRFKYHSCLPCALFLWFLSILWYMWTSLPCCPPFPPTLQLVARWAVGSGSRSRAACFYKFDSSLPLC
jgi:hypothetical protein